MKSATGHAPALLFAVSALLACSPLLGCGEARPRHLIVISLDTLRADHLGTYGYDGPTSPHLDRLAEEGAVFERAFATSPWTLPSHASLLTGLEVSGHDVRSRHDSLPSTALTLAQTLALEGFDTAAVVNAIWLTHPFGLHRGFDSFRWVPEDQSENGAAGRVTDAAIAWLRERGERRTFLLLHYFDAHSDYRSREHHERRFGPRRDESEGSTRELMSFVLANRAISDPTAQRLSRLYAAGIRQLDEELGRLFAWLADHGWDDETLIVVTSDHGEEFGEHGSVSHGRTLYDEVLRVPLVMRGPGVPARARIGSAVSIADVVPTALAALGIEAKAEVDGRDLRAFWTQPEAMVSDRPLVAEAVRGEGADGLKSLRKGHYKLIVDVRTGRSELYDLRSDPGESHDLAGERRDLVESLESELRMASARSGQSDSAPTLSDETRERLRALGYH